MILVVGGTGQLGTAVVRKLTAERKPVRAFVRRSSQYRHLEGAGVELAFGDLRDGASLEAACQAVRTVIATATAIAPGAGGGDVKAVDDDGYARLIEACRRSGVHQFIFTSVPVTPVDEQVGLLRAKRRTEERLRSSGIGYTIFQLRDVCRCLAGAARQQDPGAGRGGAQPGAAVLVQPHIPQGNRRDDRDEGQGDDSGEW